MIMGLFFGLAVYIIISMIDGVALGFQMGIFAGILFGGMLAAYGWIHHQITKKKYDKHLSNKPAMQILFEDSIFRLNGDVKNNGRLFLSSSGLRIVSLKGNTMLADMDIPLSTIFHIETKNDFGLLTNVVIEQKNGDSITFICNCKAFFDNLIPFIGYDAFDAKANKGKIELPKDHEYLKKYIDKFESPSKAFRTFLIDYFIGHPMIRGRGEEDRSIWVRLEGEELEVAIQMILDHLGHDSAYIRAVGIFRDERGIPMLKELVDTLPNSFCYEKLLVARVLYDWIGYDKYISVLDELLSDSDEYTKINLREWILGLDKELASKYIWMLLQDDNSFVRWCAYGAFLDYFKLGEQKYEDTMFYTDDLVYQNAALFKERLNTLKETISSL